MIDPLASLGGNAEGYITEIILMKIYLFWNFNYMIAHNNTNNNNRNFKT